VPEFGCEGDGAEEAACKDITTVKGRHLHQGRVVVRDAGHPTAQTELVSGSCVSVPTGGSPWLTVATGRADTRNGRTHRP
jgi:hypothetical protein